MGLAKGSKLNGDSRGAFLGSTGQITPVGEWEPLEGSSASESDGGRRGMWMLAVLCGLAFPW